MSRDILLVGSVPLESAERVFRTVAGALGDRALRIPDGETGYARSVWAQCQIPFFLAHPQLESVEPDPDRPGEYRRARVPAGGIYSRTAEGMYAGRARLRAGVDPAELRFDDLGYGDWALESYATFTRLKHDGVIAPVTRFEVDIPTPRCGISWALAGHAELLLPAYERGLGDEVARIAAAVPSDELAVQWSTVEPVRYERESPDERRARMEDLARLAAYVPDGVELGYHLCYGDFEGRHAVEPRSLATTVEMANALVERAERRIDWIHMPVPQDRADEAYFAPLAGLTLPPGTQLILGLVHAPDGLDGTRERISVASRFWPDFGISTECGWGRLQPEVIPDLLRLHLEAAQI